MRRKHYAQCRRGFTLIELLVVVAIIAVLVAILLPSLQQARDKAKDVACQSNQKQLYYAQIYYSEDNKGYLPHIWDGSLRWYWILCRDKYLPQDNWYNSNVQWCPKGGLYARNQYGPAGGYIQTLRVNEVRLPEQKIMIGDGGSIGFGRYAVWWWAYVPGTGGYVPEVRHRDGAFFIMYGGNSKWLSSSEKTENLWDPPTWDHWWEG